MCLRASSTPGIRYRLACQCVLDASQLVYHAVLPFIGTYRTGVRLLFAQGDHGLNERGAACGDERGDYRDTIQDCCDCVVELCCHQQVGASAARIPHDDPRPVSSNRLTENHDTNCIDRIVGPVIIVRCEHF